MADNKNFKFGSFTIITLVMMLSLSGCQNNQPPSGIQMELTNIFCECYSFNEPQVLEPRVMYLNVIVTNNGEKPFSVSTYNNQYDQNNRKYGYFEIVTEGDTIQLFSNYSALYELEPGQNTDFQLSYEGVMLNKFIIDEANDLDKVKELLLNAKLYFIPIPDKTEKNNLIGEVSCDIKNNSFVLEYVVATVGCKVALAYDEHKWKELPLD